MRRSPVVALGLIVAFILGTLTGDRSPSVNAQPAASARRVCVGVTSVPKLAGQVEVYRAFSDGLVEVLDRSEKDGKWQMVGE
jgi:hypothetical protein